MDNKHAQWLSLYLKNCAQMNRSSHTIKNYEADLKKFLQWFEANYPYPISRANGETITLYREFLAGIKTSGKQKPIFSKIFKLFKKKKEVVPQITQDALSIGSQKRHLSSISNFFEYLKQTLLECYE